MSDEKKAGIGARYREWLPTKATLFWSCIGSVVVALVIGFTWGGWVTGGTSRDMATTAGADARGQLASVICVERFLASPTASAQLAELKELTSSYQQRQLIEKTGFATMPEQDSANRGAADLCAKMLASLATEDLAPATADTAAATVVE
jgi:hypothetical protein